MNFGMKKIPQGMAWRDGMEEYLDGCLSMLSALRDTFYAYKLLHVKSLIDLNTSVGMIVS